MKAVTYQGHKNMEVREVNDPTIEESTDAIIKITASGICGSDLHLYHQGDLFMDPGFVIGHEPMGIVEEVGKDVKTLKKGDSCLLYTSDAADDTQCGDIGGRRILEKKKEDKSVVVVVLVI
ncbi:hypothetical protein BKL75_04375 [Staphylococcus epidermidis]|nr:hypothetical protein BKL75_04375 [Staphylococcus epidermidis]